MKIDRTHGVIFSDKNIFDNDDLILLEELAFENRRKIARINLHHSLEDQLQQMVILILKDGDVRCHKHLDKDEAFHVIEGKATLIFFDDELKKINSFKMSVLETPLVRIPRGVWHQIIVESEKLLLHEITTGPFNRERSLYK